MKEFIAAKSSASNNTSNSKNAINTQTFQPTIASLPLEEASRCLHSLIQQNRKTKGVSRN
jgi:hypothetical protein